MIPHLDETVRSNMNTRAKVAGVSAVSVANAYGVAAAVCFDQSRLTPVAIRNGEATKIDE